MLIFIVVLLVISKNWNRLQLRYSPPVKCHSAIKRTCPWHTGQGWVSVAVFWVKGTRRKRLQSVWFHRCDILETRTVATRRSVAARGRGRGKGWLQKGQGRMWEGIYSTFLYFHSDGGYMDVCVCENSQSGVLKRIHFTVCKLHFIAKVKRISVAEIFLPE